MAATGEQQPPGNQRLAPVQTARALVAATRKSPALPLPRVLQSPVIGLAGASALQPQRKKRKAENATTGATDGGSTDSPRGRPVSQWVEAQWEQRVGAQVACKHCPGYVRSGKNVSRLKQHLLQCPGFLSSSAAADAAKQDTDVSTAVARLQQQRATQQEQQQQQQPEVLDIQVEFNEFFLRFLVDNNLPFHLVENPTTKAFFNRFIPHLKLPSRYEMMQLHAFKEHINQAKEVVQYFTHMSLSHELLRQQRAALATSYHLAAATAGAGAGTAPVAGAARSAVGVANVPAPKVELQQMSQTRFASLYDMLQSPVLLEVAQRVFCTPATSAGVERLFSVFKLLWSDKRSRLLMGRMWAMAYVYFNTRALKRDEQPFAPTAAEEEQWEEWMASQPLRAPVA
ncbi:hypothetical protein QJQ45_004370 [Haematococcus lacustris]|nr:hypothetical protein QJQ45_004370 [Haematococcus lacustris]